ncbi:hypothetical protein SAMN04488137_1033 [Fictibacillus solisalsi]|uniref:Uncharacterized protein n=1 Tax=Fictibacillus solisalsi TaxID=459525 RepID=A0A1G9UNB5_9BACL|nr:hypothetical protein SAMN04488137_1033 [Fictibacillus solisalsi]
MDEGTTYESSDFFIQFGPITIVLIQTLVIIFVIWIIIRLINRVR